MADKYEEWAIVELMGHRRLAGHLSEETIAGSGWLRLDAFDADGGVFTQRYPASSSAFYAITPTTEEACRAFARAARQDPPHLLEIMRGERLLAAPEHDDDFDDEGDVDDICF